MISVTGKINLLLYFPIYAFWNIIIYLCLLHVLMLTTSSWVFTRNIRLEISRTFINPLGGDIQANNEFWNVFCLFSWCQTVEKTHAYSYRKALKNFIIHNKILKLVSELAYKWIKNVRVWSCSCSNILNFLIMWLWKTNVT